MSDPYNPGAGFSLGSPYGRRRDPITGAEGQFHSGQDFRAREGTPIPAAMAGVVVYSGFNKNLGNTVVVKNYAGEYSLYAHMKDGVARAQVGQKVWPGDIVGQVGSTGARTTGPHLHYSVIKKEASIAQQAPDGGPLGVNLNQDTTVDPAKYDVAPYLDQSLRAEQRMFAPDSSGKASTFKDRWSPVAPAPPGPGTSFDDRFGDWTSLSPNASIYSPAQEQPSGGLPKPIWDHLQRQSRQGAMAPPTSIASIAPDSPGVQSGGAASRDDSASLDERFEPASPVRRLTSRWTY